MRSNSFGIQGISLFLKVSVCFLFQESFLIAMNDISNKEYNNFLIQKKNQKINKRKKSLSQHSFPLHQGAREKRRSQEKTGKSENPTTKKRRKSFPQQSLDRQSPPNSDFQPHNRLLEAFVTPQSVKERGASQALLKAQQKMVQALSLRPYVWETKSTSSTSNQNKNTNQSEESSLKEREAPQALLKEPQNTEKALSLRPYVWATKSTNQNKNTSVKSKQNAVLRKSLSAPSSNYFKDFDHPFTDPFWRDMDISDKLKEIQKEIKTWGNDFLDGKKNSILFSEKHTEAFKKHFTGSSDILEYFKCLSFNSSQKALDARGNTQARVYASKAPDGSQIAIKNFKDIHVGMKEFYSSFYALLINPAPSRLKMAGIYDVIIKGGNRLSIIMEGMRQNDIYHFLSTDLAEKVIKACATYLAMFHIESHKSLLAQGINRDKYIEHLSKALHTMYRSFGYETEELGSLSLSTGSTEGIQVVNAQTIIRFLSPSQQTMFQSLAKNTFEVFYNNAGEIYRYLENPEQKIYPITRAHGDAHPGNFFYNDKKLDDNKVPLDSPLRISMIDFASIIRTLHGGNMEEDVARFLSALSVYLLRHPESLLNSEKIEVFKKTFREEYLKNILESGTIEERHKKLFEKIFRENCNFYTLRFYKVLFNLPCDKMSNEAKLKILELWISENSTPQKNLQNKFPADPHTKKVLWCLPDKTEGFIESISPRLKKSYLKLLREMAQDKDSINATTFSSGIVITGMGGIGKSTLALKYAYDALEDGECDVVFWLSSSTRQSLIAGYKSLLKEMKIPVLGVEDEHTLINLLNKHLPKERKSLLIYDNVPGPTFLQSKLPDNTILIITSRYNEGWEFPVLNLNVLRPKDSINYLVKMTGFKFKTRTKELDSVSEGLGYFPLALAHTIHYIKLVGGENVTKELFTKYLENFKADPNNYFKRHKNPFKNEIININYDNLIEKTYNISQNCISEASKTVMLSCAYLSSKSIKEKIFSKFLDENSLTNALTQLSSLSLINRHLIGASFSIHPLIQLVIRNEEEAKNKTPNFFLKIVDDLFYKRVKEDEFFDGIEERLEDEFSQTFQILEHAERLKESIPHNKEYAKHIEDLIWVARILYVLQKQSQKPKFLSCFAINQSKDMSYYEKNFLLDNVGPIPDWIENANNPKVQSALGYMYDEFCFIEKNIDKTSLHYKKALEKSDDMYAEYFFGKLYFQENAFADAIQHFKKIIKKWKNPDAHFMLGQLYEALMEKRDAEEILLFSASLDILFEEAIKHYRIAAQLKNKLAPTCLAKLYEKKGYFQEAMKWDIGALFLLEEAEDEKEEYFVEALQYYKTAEEKGDAEASYYMGQLYERYGHAKEAMEWYKKAAWDYGDLQALIHLGELYEIQECFSEAIECHKEAFMRQDENASYRLGCLYEGQGALEEAIKWWSISTNPDAWFRLAQSYEQLGFLKMAMKWYKKSALGGDIDAKVCLGRLYERKKSLDKARYWYKKAAHKGNLFAYSYLSQLFPQWSSSSIDLSHALHRFLSSSSILIPVQASDDVFSSI